MTNPPPWSHVCNALWACRSPFSHKCTMVRRNHMSQQARPVHVLMFAGQYRAHVLQIAPWHPFLSFLHLNSREITVYQCGYNLPTSIHQEYGEGMVEESLVTRLVGSLHHIGLLRVTNPGSIWFLCHLGLPPLEPPSLNDWSPIWEPAFRMRCANVPTLKLRSISFDTGKIKI